MPVAMRDANGAKYYLHYDQVGSIRAVSDTNGNVVKDISYDTFGNILNDSNPSFHVPFGFAGGLYDPLTKLTHFGYREYDAFTGKWTVKDPYSDQGIGALNPWFRWRVDSYDFHPLWGKHRTLTNNLLNIAGAIVGDGLGGDDFGIYPPKK